MALAPELAGTQCEPVHFAWERDDVLLYAVAVGAGAHDPTTELSLTTENTEGVRTAVLPSFAEIITRNARVDLGEIDHSMLVHAEQSFRLTGPLPVTGRARVTSTVTDVLDKGSGALIRTEARAMDAQTGAPLASTVRSVFVRGEGGFAAPAAGSRPGGSSPVSPIPDRAPDHEVTYPTSRCSTGSPGTATRCTTTRPSPPVAASTGRSCTACAPTGSPPGRWSRPSATATPNG